MRGQGIPKLTVIDMEIGQVAEIEIGVFADVPSCEGQQHEKPKIKIICRKDAKGPTDEKIIGGIQFPGRAVLFREEDRRDQIAAEHKEEGDKGPEIDRKRDL